MTQPQLCCSTAPSPHLQNLPTRPLFTPLPPHLCEDPQLLSTAPISDQPPPNSSCWQFVRTSKGTNVTCPVCKIQLATGFFYEHMKKHEKQTSQWNRKRQCQLCVDQGNYSKRVSPRDLWLHTLKRHELNGDAPLHVQSDPADHPMPTPAPAPNIWQFIQGSSGKKKDAHFVICPCPNLHKRCRVKPQNLVKHMRKVHQVGLEDIENMRQQCQGCKLAVSPGELSAHIDCQEPTYSSSSPPTRYLGPRLAQDPEWADWIKRVQLKRKATTSV